jgi:hypothetical protein
MNKLPLLLLALLLCVDVRGQTNQPVNVTNEVPVITHLQIDPAQLESRFNSFTALIGLAGAWLMREVMTIGANGGVVGLWGYFWRGVKPNPTTISQIVTTSNAAPLFVPQMAIVGQGTELAEQNKTQPAAEIDRLQRLAKAPDAPKV